MIKMVFAFVAVFVLVCFAIELFRSAPNRERWQLTKTLTYGIIVSVVTAALLAGFVLLF